MEERKEEQLPEDKERKEEKRKKGRTVRSPGEGKVTGEGPHGEDGKAEEGAPVKGDFLPNHSMEASGAETGEPIMEWEDIPILKLLSLPARKQKKGAGKMPRAKRSRRHGGEGKASPRPRLKGLFRRISEGSRSVAAGGWRPDTPLSESPNLAFTQASAEREVLSVLRARAPLLDSLGSPLPVTRLLGGLCGSSFEGAATAITLMTERFARGLLREGPVWGLPKEVTYAITGPPRRVAEPKSELMRAPEASKGKTTAGKPQKGKYRQQREKPEAKASNKARSEGTASGPSGGKPNPTKKPRVTPKSIPDPRF